MQNPNRRITISAVILSALALCIHIAGSMPDEIERLYSSMVYPLFSSFLRKALGALPFSVGDILYTVLSFLVLWKLVQWLMALRKKKTHLIFQKKYGLRIIVFSLLIYNSFNLLWGLNYNRKGIHYQLNMEGGEYSAKELFALNQQLLEKVNECKQAQINTNTPYPSTKELFQRASLVFRRAAEKYPFLQYTHSSVKPTPFNFLGNYFGYSGYYNPFTGEAQINTDVPEFLLPFITCHEISHQLGYAKENEASFAGFIAATSSADSLFMYSAYFELFLYANRNLYRTDSITAKALSDSLHADVKTDIEKLKAYYKKYETPIEPVFRWVYGKFLKANEQPMGMVTYSEVVADVIAWYKKTGELSN